MTGTPAPIAAAVAPPVSPPAKSAAPLPANDIGSLSTVAFNLIEKFHFVPAKWR